MGKISEKNTVFTFYIPKELHARLKKVADRKDVSMAWVARRYIENGVTQYERILREMNAGKRVIRRKKK